MIQLTMELASIYDTEANDITIELTKNWSVYFLIWLKKNDFRMYTAPENMPLH